MSIDSKIVTNWDISMHGISDISEVKLCVLTLKNIHILLSGRGENGCVLQITDFDYPWQLKRASFLDLVTSHGATVLQQLSPPSWLKYWVWLSTFCLEKKEGASFQFFIPGNWKGQLSNFLCTSELFDFHTNMYFSCFVIKLLFCIHYVLKNYTAYKFLEL